MRIQILGKRWRLRFCRMKDWGSCSDPNAPGREIRIRQGISEQNELTTLVHEMLHAADWSKDESWVSEVSEDIGRVLYRLGWRKESK